MSLVDVLKSTVSKSAQIQETAQDVEIAKSQLDQARAAAFPKGEALILTAPIPEITGTAQGTQTNFSKWGPWVKGGLQLVQPLYTFGQIGGFQKAALGQLHAKEELLQMKRAEVVLNAKEFYYGYQLANALESLVKELVEYLDEAVTAAEKKSKKKKKGGVKPHDLYKLKTTLDDLKQKLLLATQAKQTAEKAVAWVSGSSVEGIRATSIAVEIFEKKPLEEYLKIARGRRPEFKAIAAGKEARAALRDAKQAQSYPTIFFGAFGTTAWSPMATPQNSVYVNDVFNGTYGGAALGFKLDLEFKRHSAEASEQEAELMKLKATEAYAAPGIDLQVKKAFYEVEQAEQGLEVATRRRALARKWFTSNAMGWSIGITSPKDLMEALEGNGLARKNYFESIYAFNLALAHLSQAIGQEVVASLAY